MPLRGLFRHLKGSHSDSNSSLHGRSRSPLPPLPTSSSGSDFSLSTESTMSVDGETMMMPLFHSVGCRLEGPRAAGNGVLEVHPTHITFIFEPQFQLQVPMDEIYFISTTADGAKIFTSGGVHEVTGVPAPNAEKTARWLQRAWCVHVLPDQGPLSDSDLSQLLDSFQELDVDGNGQLTVDEFAAPLRALGRGHGSIYASSIFRGFSGSPFATTITGRRFVRTMFTLLAGAPDSRAAFTFRVFGGEEEVEDEALISRSAFCTSLERLLAVLEWRPDHAPAETATGAPWERRDEAARVWTLKGSSGYCSWVFDHLKSSTKVDTRAKGEREHSEQQKSTAERVRIDWDDDSFDSPLTHDNDDEMTFANFSAALQSGALSEVCPVLRFSGEAAVGKGTAMTMGDDAWDTIVHLLNGLRACTQGENSPAAAVAIPIDPTPADSVYADDHPSEGILSTERLKELTAEAREFHFSSVDGGLLPSALSRGGNANDVVTFTEYAPQVFKEIRRRLDLDGDRYLEVLGSDRIVADMALGRMSAPFRMTTSGRSGSFFMTTHDERIMLKTLPQKEARTLLNMLPNYFEHLVTSPRSILSLYVGLYEMRVGNNDPMKVVAMLNVFPRGVKINQLFDLKGSTAGRSVPQEERDKEGVALKDLDFQEMRGQVVLSEANLSELIGAIDGDAAFLQYEGCTDYSLLVGVAELPQVHAKMARDDHVETKESSGQQAKSANPEDPMAEDNPGGSPQLHVGGLEEIAQAPQAAEIFGSLVHNTSSENFRVPGIHCYLSARGDEVLYFGIIDILTPYDATKFAERAVKSLYQTNPSCCAPDNYAQRFVRFMRQVLKGHRTERKYDENTNTWTATDSVITLVAPS